jgi:hypothetical protein
LLFQVAAPRPPDLPGQIPITRDGLPDLAALRDAGREVEAAEYDLRCRAVARLRRVKSESKYGDHRDVDYRVGAEFRVSARTLRRWATAFSRWGWAGLLRAYGRSAGAERAIPKELGRRILDAYAYQGCLNAMQIYTDIVVPWFAQDGRQLPHPATVRAYIKRHVPPMVKTISRDGSRAWTVEHEAKVARDLDSAGVNGWWASDHRRADTFVLVADGLGQGWPGPQRGLPCTCGSGVPRRECCSVRRLWWTMTVDIASATIIGLRCTTQPTAATVAHQLHQAILEVGLPGHWVRDNGKEFVARRLGGRPGRLTDLGSEDLDRQCRAPAAMPELAEETCLWQQLGVELVTCLPYHPWSKYCETIFSAFARRFENRIPGDCRRSADSRPEKLQQEIADGALLTADQYITVLRDWMADWNSGRPIGERRQPPIAYYKEYRGRIPDGQTLCFLLQDVRHVRVRTGAIKLDDHIYMSADLARFSGCNVTVRWDPGDPGTAYVYPPQGSCIAVAECPKARYGEWGEANVRAAEARKAQRAAIREWAVGKKGSCPRELLDKWGAHRAVAERLRLAADQVAQEQRTLPEPEAAPQPMRRRTIYAVDPEEEREIRELEEDAGIGEASPPISAAAIRQAYAAMDGEVVRGVLAEAETLTGDFRSRPRTRKAIRSEAQRRLAGVKWDLVPLGDLVALRRHGLLPADGEAVLTPALRSTIEAQLGAPTQEA